jgi:hypothetical protein
MAIWRRVSEYGITENRYVVLLLGLWLAAIVVYFLLSKTPSIKVIPASLCLGALLTSFGPWGAFQISERSQVHRLEKLLAETGILKNEKVGRAPGEVSYEQAREISSIVRYLYNTHGLKSIQPWFSANLDTLAGGPGADRAGEKIPKIAVTELLGVEYIAEWQTKKTVMQRYTTHQPRAFDVRGYDWLFRGVNVRQSDVKTKAETFPFGTIRLWHGEMRLAFSSAEIGTDSITFDFEPLVRRLSEQFKNPDEIPGDVMVVEGKGERLHARVNLGFLTAQSDKDSVSVWVLDGDLLVGRPNQ